MDKIFNKKNLGIPVTFLVLISYFIGYYISGNLYGLLVAVLFGALVFALDFDERVRTAVKQSYVLGLLFNLLFMLVGILNQLMDMIATITSNVNPFILERLINGLYRITNDALNIAAIVVFVIIVLLTLAKKDVKINFILNMIGEGATKQSQLSIQQAQALQQQVPTAATQQILPGTVCPICQTLNKEGASFCASCGNKLK